MIDSHCHLDFSQFDHDRDQVLVRAQQAGVSKIIVPGVQASQWTPLVALCQHNPMLEFALGIHPYFIKHAKQADLQRLKQALVDNAGVTLAVGEIGLDFHLADRELTTKQQYFFEAQLALASEYQLPVILHHRQSHNQIIQTLKFSQFQYGGVLHAFSGSYEQAKTYIDMGFKLGIGGTITYPRAVKTRDTVKRLDLHDLVLETDAPDMPIYGRQGKRNSPEFLPEIAQQLALLTANSYELVLSCTADATRLLFGLQGNE
jgi:TatD DNase family protein